MKKIILFFLILLNSFFAFSDSGTIHYFLKGKAFSNSNQLLKNEVFVLEKGLNKRIIKTNEFGEFEIKLTYYFPCPSGVDSLIYDLSLAIFNGKSLQFYNENSSFELPWNWEKFRTKRREEKAEMTDFQNLYFQKDNSCSSDFKNSIHDFKEKSAMMHETHIDEWKRKLSTEKALQAGRFVFNTFSFLNMRKEEIFDLLNLSKRCHLLINEPENEVFCGFNMGAAIWTYTFRFENDKVIQVDSGIINF